MSKKIVSSLVGIALIAPLVSFAEETVSAASGAAQTRRQVIEEQNKNRGEKVQNAKEKRDEAAQTRRAKIAEKAKQKIRTYFVRMAARFEAALAREKKLGDRIQSRIDKAKERGKNISKAQNALDQARTKWQEAKAALDSAKSKLEGMLESADPKAAFQDIQKLVSESRDKIKAVHAALVEAVRQLKGIGEGGASATTTPSAAGSPSESNPPSQ